MATWEELDLDAPMQEEGEPNLIPASEVRVPIRLSHSSRNLLRGCERKYYLTRYKVLDELDLPPADTDKNNEHLDFGSALGVGIQHLLETENLQAAVWKTIRTFNFAYETDSKNLLSLVAALQSFHAQWNYDDWEFIKGEASFKIILDEESGDYTCGFIDAIIRNKVTGYFMVVEIKTTGAKYSDLRPMYQNSDQGVGYSVVLDAVVPNLSTFHVLYIVLQLKYNDIRPTWHFFPFPKTRKDKLEFLLTQQMDYEYLRKLEEVDFWPMRGNHCMTFGRTCHLMGVCNLSTIHELPYMPAKPEAKWDYVFKLDNLIQEQLS